MFLGDGRSTTIITGSRNVKDGSTTFKSATVEAFGVAGCLLYYVGRSCCGRKILGPGYHFSKYSRTRSSDLSAFYRCDFLGHQDILYVHSNRHFFVQCLIAGTVNFIFGNGATVDIHARRPGSGQKNMVTAQGRTDPNQNTGIVMHKSRIGATSDLRPVQGNFPTYLGRP